MASAEVVSEELVALTQQDEFRTRLFPESSVSVISALSVTKQSTGFSSALSSGIPKQFFLLLTYNRKGDIDWRVHSVRLKDDGKLVVRTTYPITQLTQVSCADEIEFSLKWHNGQTDHWTLSSGSLRSIEMFVFLLMVAHKNQAQSDASGASKSATSGTSSGRRSVNAALMHCPFELKGSIDIKALNVAGKQWLSLLFQNSELQSRITSFEQALLRPTWVALVGLSSMDGASGSASGDDADGDEQGDSKKGKRNQERGVDIPLITEEETSIISGFLKQFGLTAKNAHLLESRLISKEEELMGENIKALTMKERELQQILEQTEQNYRDLNEIFDTMRAQMPKVRAMESTMSGIKAQNEKLAVQDLNYVKLRTELAALLKALNFSNAATHATLRNPRFHPQVQYRESLRAAYLLKQKLELKLDKPCLESLDAVKQKRGVFKTLAEDFAEKAGLFLKERFSVLKKDGDQEFAHKQHVSASTGGGAPRKESSAARSLGVSAGDSDLFSIDAIHDGLEPYSELLELSRGFHLSTFAIIKSEYQKTFTSMYSNQFKSLFHSLNKRMKSDSKAANHIASFKKYQLEEFMHRNEVETSELSVSHTFSTLFRGGATSTVPMRSVGASMMTTIDEDGGEDARISATKALLIALSQILPVIAKERRFLLRYFFRDSSKNKDTAGVDTIDDDYCAVAKREVEKMIATMFGSLLPELNTLCDKACKNEPAQALRLHIIAEVALEHWKEESDLIAQVLVMVMGSLSMQWNKFIDAEVKWITDAKPHIKQAGVLEPMSKFPAFINHVFAVHKIAEQRSREIVTAKESLMLELERNGQLGVSDTVPSEEEEAQFGKPGLIGARKVSEVSTGSRGSRSEKRISSKIVVSTVEDDALFGDVKMSGNVLTTANNEGALLRSTIHKLGAALFDWLQKISLTDPKYTDVCLMENMHYFYVIFRHSDKEVSSLSEYIGRSKTTFRKYLDKYVKWSIEYECKILVEFWDKLSSQIKKSSRRGGTAADSSTGGVSGTSADTVSVFLPSSELQSALKGSLKDMKMVRKHCTHMFERMQKHLRSNPVLQQFVWKRLTEYLVTKLSRFERNIEKYYQAKLPIKLSEFEAEYKGRYSKAFDLDFDDDRRSELSIGGSSAASSATGISSAMRKRGTGLGYASSGIASGTGSRRGRDGMSSAMSTAASSTHSGHSSHGTDPSDEDTDDDGNTSFSD